MHMLQGFWGLVAYGMTLGAVGAGALVCVCCCCFALFKVSPGTGGTPTARAAWRMARPGGCGCSGRRARARLQPCAGRPRPERACAAAVRSSTADATQAHAPRSHACSHASPCSAPAISGSRRWRWTHRRMPPLLRVLTPVCVETCHCSHTLSTTCTLLRRRASVAQVRRSEMGVALRSGMLPLLALCECMI